MMRAVIAGRGPCRDIADDLRTEGVQVMAIVPRSAPAEAAAAVADDALAAELLELLAEADLLVVDAARDAVTADLVATCDGLGVRIVVRCARDDDERLAASFGLQTVSMRAPAREITASRPPSEAPERPRGRVVTVWGPAGAPGRSTVAIGIGAALAREGCRVALADADTHAPSIALATGAADDGPGFATVCRQAERGGLMVAELARVAQQLHGMSVLAGINRPARWPELSGARVKAALDMCRDWVDVTVVDVAASLEADEEIVSDLDGHRRNAASLAAVGMADVVVAVAAADPIGISRFVREYPDLRAAAGRAMVHVLVNKTRGGVLGVDPRGQVRRTLERYAGVRQVWFAPFEPRAADAALLRAQPLAEGGRSSLAGAVRRFAREAIGAGERSDDLPRRQGRRRRGIRAA